jgi:cytochrome c
LNELARAALTERLRTLRVGKAVQERTNGGFVIRLYLIASAIVVGLATSAHAQDAAAGEKEFLVCKACHQIGPVAKIAIGPVLNGVVGRKAGTFPGFEYSPANKDSGIVWTPEELDKYLANPQAVVPHTKMVFPGIKDDKKRKDVIAYLQQFNEDGTKKN